LDFIFELVLSHSSIAILSCVLEMLYQENMEDVMELWLDFGSSVVVVQHISSEVFTCAAVNFA